MKTAPLILVTAGGLARETAAAVRAGTSYDVAGYVDDSPDLWGREVNGALVLGGIDQLTDHPAAAVVICAGKGVVRERIAARLDGMGITADRLVTVIHPGVHVPAGCAVGTGSILLAGCVMTASVTLGRHVVCMPNAVLTHDDQVADFATLCAGVTLGGAVRVGQRAYLGMSCSVRENVTVGSDAVLGMGSVALVDIPAKRTWAGVPARPLDRSSPVADSMATNQQSPAVGGAR